MRQNYDEAIRLLLISEGGNDDDPQDPGGRTSRGILQREWNVWRQAHPGLPEDVWKAPQDQVIAIYKQNYWDKLSCDQLSSGVDYAVFDYGVNSGISRSAKVLQSLIHTSVDGTVGPLTIEVANKVDPKQLITAICDQRLAFLKGLGTWSHFGRGWARRVSEVRATSLRMAGKIPVTIKTERTKMDNLNFFQKIQDVLAGFMPGSKTIVLAGGLAGINILDWLQMNYQTFSPALELIPEPYKTIINVAVPALIMFFRNITQRNDAAKIQAVKLPS